MPARVSPSPPCLATSLPECYTDRPRRREDTMAYACELCGKKRQKAHKVSHSNIKTRKWQRPNLQSIRAVVDGRVTRLRVCTRCIRANRIEKAV